MMPSPLEVDFVGELTALSLVPAHHITRMYTTHTHASHIYAPHIYNLSSNLILQELGKIQNVAQFL
jgi:hypothetical protein